MRNANGRVGRIHALATGAGGTVDVDTKIVRVKLFGEELVFIGLIGFGDDEDTDGRGVNAPLRLGHGHALHTVHTAFVLEVSPHAFRRADVASRADRHREVFVATEIRFGLRDDFGAPAILRRVRLVHAHEIRGKERGLIATRTGLDLEDHVTSIVGIARGKQLFELRRELLTRAFESVSFLRHRGVLFGEFASGLEILACREPFAVRADHGPEFGVAAPHSLGLVVVIMKGRVGHLLLEGRVFVNERGHVLKHEGLSWRNEADVVVLRMRKRRRHPTWRRGADAA